MEDSTLSKRQLQEKMDLLVKRQEEMAREIRQLASEIRSISDPVTETVPPPEPVPETPKYHIEVPEIPPAPAIPMDKDDADEDSGRFSRTAIERFIGENLINKIGIAITIIGVGIGTKYSIDHQLISPMMRIILGYLMGIGLLAFGVKLKKNYHNYSAVLMSGAMAIMYFITYAAYDFYALMPQSAAFALMVMITAFTVLASHYYNNQVIAHIGMVGAYAVPFILSDGSGKVMILFSYVSIINIGILLVAYKKYWKLLYFMSFLFSWLIFLSWLVFEYKETLSLHFQIGFVFSTIFFLTFYAIFMAYKIIQHEPFKKMDIILVLSNTFVYYSAGYFMLEQNASGTHFKGLFTLAIALVHILVWALVTRNKNKDYNLYALLMGLAVVFITMAIPVQLDGNWVTLIWLGEAALLFYIGRNNQAAIYEILSYPLMLLAFISLFDDWQSGYGTYDPEIPASWLMPVFNLYFMSSALFIATFSLILFFHKRNPQSAMSSSFDADVLMKLIVPAMLLTVIYFSLRIEISNYFSQLYKDTLESQKPQEDSIFYNPGNFDLVRFRTMWLLNYSMIFFSVLSYVNLKKIKNLVLGYASVAFSLITMLVFLSQGLHNLNHLKISYMSYTPGNNWGVSSFHMIIRYISYLILGMLTITLHQYVKSSFFAAIKEAMKTGFDLFLNIIIITIASFELHTWLDILGHGSAQNLGISIFWGIYSLILIVIGIWKNRQHLRMAAIILFAITLVKLFFYDIAHLNTISKTIVFVILGILLLIISFLYNKYKHKMKEEVSSE